MLRRCVKRSTSNRRRRGTARADAPAASSPIVITIDGPAGAGKSTAAKLLAKRLGLMYLDTGATYRALAFAVLERGIDPHRAAQVAALARRIDVDLKQADGGVLVLLDGRDVTREIRVERVTETAAIIAQHPAVRTALVGLQRRLAATQSLVAEGRDTGSVVFPDAALKFFLTANVRVRAQRRRGELEALYGEAPSITTLVSQLRRRDRLDRSRSMGPLVQPRGSIKVDTSEAGSDEVVSSMLRHVSLAVLRGGHGQHGACCDGACD